MVPRIARFHQQPNYVRQFYKQNIINRSIQILVQVLRFIGMFANYAIPVENRIICFLGAGVLTTNLQQRIFCMGFGISDFSKPLIAWYGLTV